MTGPSTTGATGRVARRFAVLGLVLALGACAAGAPRRAADHPPAPPEPAPQVTSVPPAASPPPEPPPPPKLLGLAHDEVVGILGPPVFRRHDAPALLMRYRAGGCILDLYLYPAAGEGGADRQAVEHVEARTSDGRPGMTPACITEIMKARAANAGDGPG